jgi:two-component sensor histidine kinase
MRFLAELATRSRSPAFCWSFALAAFLAAVVVRAALHDALPGLPFVTFFPAVIVTTFLCGLWPGIATAIVSCLAAWYLFLPPLRSFALEPSGALALGFYVFIVSVDIAIIHVMNVALERLRAERERSQRLAESRAVMFKELQHRVSNNLQMVSALMSLQKGSVRDEQARRVLDEAAARLALIGKIHRQLHDPSGQQVELGRFLKHLCHDVLAASGASSVVCLVQAEPMALAPERTVPLALIVAELVSNALEHAFAGRANGTITIDLTRRPDHRASLTVADDGVGLPPDFDQGTVPSLGLQIVRAFARQLGGTFAMASAGGTRCSLEFPIDA